MNKAIGITELRVIELLAQKMQNSSCFIAIIEKNLENVYVWDLTIKEVLIGVHQEE